MAAVGDIVDRALQHLGVSPLDQGFSGQDANLALDMYNEIMQAWSDDFALKSAPVLFKPGLDVNQFTDVITINGHLFADGDAVTYGVFGGTAIGGLTKDTKYFIVNSAAGSFKLAVASGGTAIDLTSVGTGVWHSFLKDEGTTGYIHIPQERTGVFALGLRYVPGVAAMLAERLAPIKGVAVPQHTASAANAGYALLLADFQKDTKQDLGILNRMRRF